MLWRRLRRDWNQPWSALRIYRLMFLVGMLMLPGFGLLYDHYRPDAFDPSGARVALGALCAALYVWTFSLAWVRRYLSQLYRVTIVLIALWWVGLAAYNVEDAAYALGSLFTLPTLCVVFSVGLQQMRAQVLFSAGVVLAMAVVYGLSPAAPEGVVAPLLVVALVASICLMVCLVVWNTQTIYQRLQESMLRHEAVLYDATDGICLLDGETLRFLEVNPSALNMLDREEETLLEMSFPDIAPHTPALRDSFDEARVHGRAEFGPLGLDRARGTQRFLDIQINRLETRERLFSVVLRDVSARKEYEAELVAARQHAEEMEAFKSSMLSNVGHEVRTPVSIIVGCASVLRNELEGDHADLMDDIIAAGGRLHRMLDLLLEMAQMEAGTRQLQDERLDVGQVAERIAQSMRPQAHARGLNLTVVRPARAIVARVDRSSLHRVLEHLVDNAIKFTEHGQVTVRVEDGVDRVRIHVEDTGIGLSEAFQQHLFTPFRQASMGLSRSHEGFGLGLHLTERIVRLMRGTLTCHSTPAVGTTFILDFPNGDHEGTASGSGRPEVSVSFTPISPYMA